jgi:hypothetical protein
MPARPAFTILQAGCTLSNLAKNCSTVPKTDADLHIPIINPCTKFHFSTCNHCKENERRLLVDRQTEANQYALPSSSEGMMK